MPGLKLQISFLFLILVNVAYSQPSTNLGFDLGTFNGWTGASGQCCPVYTPFQGIDTSHHIITSGNYFDPNSLALVPVVAPGSLFSARLGNSSGSAESEILDYSFTVTADSMLLVIRFAVILENANHPASKQPRFGYEITSNSGLLQGCLTEQVVAGNNSYNFILNGTYEILNWQTRIINLTGMQGETISVHFETGDCEPGGHFGYAYVDGELVEAKINSSTCNADGSLTLYVPPGLNGLWFNGETGDSTVIQEPAGGAVYTLELLPNSNCNITLEKIIDFSIPDCQFTSSTDCNFNTLFDNISVCDPGTLYTWDFGDGNFSNLTDPSHLFANAGIFDVTLTTIQPNNCRDLQTKTISLNTIPELSILTSGNCPGDEINFSVDTLSTSITGFEFSWFIDEELISETTNAQFTFIQEGIHNVKLVYNDLDNCTDTSYYTLELSDSCHNDVNFYIPSAFTPNGDGKNDIFEILNQYSEIPLTLQIFSRFGENIFTGKKWDGNFAGVQCPIGLYAYQVLFGKGEVKKQITGTVMLIR